MGGRVCLGFYFDQTRGVHSDPLISHQTFFAQLNYYWQRLRESVARLSGSCRTYQTCRADNSDTSQGTPSVHF